MYQLLFVLCILLQGASGAVLFQCDFESSDCDLQFTEDTNGFTWSRNQGPTASEGTGPSADHTRRTEDGTYIYAEATDFDVGSVANFTLPDLNTLGTGPFCLTFWYHMMGQHIGRLEVKAETPSGVENLWNRSRDQGANDTWLQANASVSAATLTISFSTIRGGSVIGEPYGDIAVDDILLTDIEDGPCAYETTTAPAPETTTSQPLETSAADVATTEGATTSTESTTAITDSTTRQRETPSTRGSDGVTGTESAAETSTSALSSSPPAMNDETTAPSSSQTSAQQTSVSSSSSSSSTGNEETTEDGALKTTCPPPRQSETEDELWGLEETSWIIILAAMAAVILILLLVVIVQACALAKMKTARITKKCEDYDNFRDYTKYTHAYDNMGHDIESGVANGNLTTGTTTPVSTTTDSTYGADGHY